MQEIKYQKLKNHFDNDCNNDDYTDLPAHHNRRQHHYPEQYNENNSTLDFKIPWILKLLFLCFVIVKIIYVINNYEMLINWLNPKHNQTEIYENSTLFFVEETTEKLVKDQEEKPRNLDKISTIYANEYNFTSSDNEIIYELYDETTTVGNIFKTNNEQNLTIINNLNNANLTTTTTTKILKIVISNEDTTTTNTPTTIALQTTTLPTTTPPTTTLPTTTPLPTTLLYLNDSKITSTILQTTTKNDLLEKSTTSMTPPLRPPVLAPILKASVPLPPVKQQQKYFINTSRCHIPFVDPFTSDVRKIFKPKHSTGCTKDQPIISASYNDENAEYILHINYAVAEKLRKTSNITIEDDVLCCYQEILRSGSGTKADTSFKLLPCTNFHQDFVVPLHIHGVIVNCKSKSTNSKLQEDAISFIQMNKTVAANKMSKNNTSLRRKPSVLMIGIDTLSRINFRRNMPEMHKYLKENKWHELMGYNKVGDNTLPNLMPLLSGYTRSTTYNKCKPQKVGGFDDCNFLWSTFKKHGYYTGYAEDSTSITTFNYHLKGFKNPPTDYYFRPIALAIEKTMKKKTKAGLNYCIGRKQFGEYIYDYGLEFATRYQNLSSFGFFWTNSFSHNSYDVSATMDKTMVNYFREFEKRGIFENSVVIFFSDHGVRWGPLLKLPQGFLEERLPMFFISMPKWFQQDYPDLMRNLEINQQRLVTPYDIHMTLQHLLKLAEPSYNISTAYDCPKSQTIFQEISENRTCDEACIPEAWCTCIPFKIESTKSTNVKSITNLIIQEMNQYYVNRNLTSLCSPLELKEITMAKQHYQDEFKSLNVSTYVIDFVTNPKTEPKTLFSATVDYDVNTRRIHLNVEDISRQSKYENTAKCTDDKQAKKYCICKNSSKVS